jgi:hypothetical protein
MASNTTFGKRPNPVAIKAPTLPPQETEAQAQARVALDWRGLAPSSIPSRTAR